MQLNSNAGILLVGLFGSLASIVGLAVDVLSTPAALLSLSLLGLVVVVGVSYDYVQALRTLGLEFVDTLRVTGITDGSPRREGSKYEGDVVLSEIDDHFDFMGVHGSDWLEEDEALEDMLDRVRAMNGQVRFLVVHPDDEDYRHNKPDDREWKWCYEGFAELEAAYSDALSVRLYRKVPNFRVAIVDKSEAYVSRYFLNGEDPDDYDNQPMVEMQRDADWNFFESYLKYFDVQWDSGYTVDLSEAEIDAFEFDHEDAAGR